MSLNPRRSGAALWVLWVAASALGGALASLLPLSGAVGLVLESSSYFAVLAYFGAFAAIGASCQSVVLVFVARGGKAALLWVPATLLGASLVYGVLNELVFDLGNAAGSLRLLAGGSMPAIFAAAFAMHALAVGLAQGLVLTLITTRKAALPIWIAGSLLAQPVSDNFTFAYIGGWGRVANVIWSNMLAHGAGAAVTGVALLLILRLSRRQHEAVAPKEVPALEGQG